MDRDPFGCFARALAGMATRRRLGGLLLAFGAGSATAFGSVRGDEAAARRQRRKRRKKRNKTRDKPAACHPDCADKDCGPDGCGGSCGSCGGLTFCNTEGTCAPICLPDCTGAECGSDGCGGSCGTCPDGKVCFGDPGTCFSP